MKTKDVVLSGLLIAIFLLFGGICRGSIRIVQTYMEIVKSITIAVGVRSISKKAGVYFLFSCFILSVFTLPFIDTIVYNVPSIIGGYILGKGQSIKQFFIYIIINIFLVVYEISMYSKLVNINLWDSYRKQATEIVVMIPNLHLPNYFFTIIFVCLIVTDAMVSATIIWNIARLIFNRIDKYVKISNET